MEKVYLALILCSLIMGLSSESDLSNPTMENRDFAVRASCTFTPEKCDKLVIDKILEVYVNCSAYLVSGLESGSIQQSPGDLSPVLGIRPFSTNSEIAEIEGNGNGEIRLVWDTSTARWVTSTNDSFAIHAYFLGRTTLKFKVTLSSDTRLINKTILLDTSNVVVKNSSKNGKSEVDPSLIYHVSVVREERFIDHMFLGIVMLLVIGGNIGMGCKIDLNVVKGVLKKPIAPVIGFCCQYIIMPLTAYGLVRLIGLTEGMALGLFAAGCAPGGSSSNMYTYLLEGDVSLSVTLTLISLLASLGMIPLYLFTLGRTLISSEEFYFQIPFRNIFTSLASLLLPVGLGVILQYKCPRVAKAIIKCLRPFYIILLLFIFTVGVYSNVYIFRLITPLTVVAGLSLPYLGFFLSGLAAVLLRLPRAHWITIAIETGLQNTGIPIILLKFSLPQPEADISVVAPIVVAMFMPLPLWIAVGIVEGRRRRRKCGKKNEMDGIVAAEDPDCEMKEISMATVPLTQNGDKTAGDHAANGTDKHKEINDNFDRNGQVGNHGDVLEKTRI